jgi:V/A-type H+-transporting ATPase subunit A
MRVVGTFWALDYDLSRRRHFPAINWLHSYSLYDFHAWYAMQVAGDWETLTHEAMTLLQREAELLNIVRLVGPDTLSEPERAVLFVARMLREDFLHQASYQEVDRFCPIDKAYWMLTAIMEFYRYAREALASGVALTQITASPTVTDIARMKQIPATEAVDEIKLLIERQRRQFKLKKATSS